MSGEMPYYCFDCQSSFGNIPAFGKCPNCGSENTIETFLMNQIESDAEETLFIGSTDQPITFGENDYEYQIEQLEDLQLQGHSEVRVSA